MSCNLKIQQSDRSVISVEFAVGELLQTWSALSVFVTLDREPAAGLTNLTILSFNSDYPCSMKNVKLRYPSLGMLTPNIVLILEVRHRDYFMCFHVLFDIGCACFQCRSLSESVPGGRTAVIADKSPFKTVFYCDQNSD